MLIDIINPETDALLKSSSLLCTWITIKMLFSSYLTENPIYNSLIYRSDNLTEIKHIS
jgi:hypothetical protein